MSFNFTTATGDGLDDPVLNPGETTLFGGKSGVIQVLYYVLSSIGIPGNITAIVVLSSAEKLRKKPINLFLVCRALHVGLLY